MQRQAGLAIGGWLFFQSHGPALVSLIADLHRSGVAQGLLDEELGDFRRFAVRLEIDRFDEGVHPLPLVGFCEARHRAAHRCDRTGLVVAVLSAQPHRRYEECARRRHLLVQHAHGGIKRFDPHPQGFMPGSQVHDVKVSLVVQGRQPVNSLYWTRG